MKATVANIFNPSTITHCKGVCALLFNALSLVTVVSLSILTMYWWVDDSTVTKIEGYAPTVISTPGSLTEVQPLVRITAQPRISYTLQLFDSNKELVATYPESISTESLNKLIFRIPANIKGGVYSLVVDLKYLKNPVKVSTLKIELAHVEIRN